MMDVKIYLKPRPISPVYGHSNYLPFKWPFDCEYGPFFADHGAIPSDATEVYTVQSPPLAAPLSMLFNELIPSLDVEVPDPNRAAPSTWPDLLYLAMAKVHSSFHFRIECENHIVGLSQGDDAPPQPPPHMRAPTVSPEWFRAISSVLYLGDVELCDDKFQEVELELFIWVYMYHTAHEGTYIWRSFRQEMYLLVHPIDPVRLPSGYTEKPGLFDFITSKALTAASTLVSSFTIKTSINENEPPLLSPSSSDESSATDSTSSSHAGDFNSDDDVKLSALYRPFRRRNPVVADSVDV